MNYTIKLIQTSILDGEELFGTFVGKLATHADMLKAAKALIATFKGIHGGVWDFTWDSHKTKPATKHGL